MFSSKSFTVSGITFRSLIQPLSLFLYGVRKWSNFILLQVVIQFSQHHLLIKAYIFNITCIFIFTIWATHLVHQNPICPICVFVVLIYYPTWSVFLLNLSLIPNFSFSSAVFQTRKWFFFLTLSLSFQGITVTFQYHYWEYNVIEMTRTLLLETARLKDLVLGSIS